MTDRTQPFRQQDDVLNGSRVALGAYVVLVVSAIMVAAAVFVCARGDAHLRPSGVFPEARLGPRHAVARVHQDLFATGGIGQQLERAERERLEHFQWADAGQRSVRIPIDDAMNLWLARHRGAP